MQPEQEREPLGDPEDDGQDFAEEHDDLAVADEERGGPEGLQEDESPEGYGGGDL